ncbi:hypothetical protein Tco_0899650 [Tanacetum coccineum]
MAIHSWIESMQDELNQFEGRLQVGNSFMTNRKESLFSQWSGKTKCDAENIVVPKQIVLWKRIQQKKAYLVKVEKSSIRFLSKHLVHALPMATERLDDDSQVTPMKKNYHRLIGGLMYYSQSIQILLLLFSMCSLSMRVLHSKTSKRDVKMIGKAYGRICNFLGGKACELGSKKQIVLRCLCLRLEYVSLLLCASSHLDAYTILIMDTTTTDSDGNCDARVPIAISCNPISNSKDKAL